MTDHVKTVRQLNERIRDAVDPEARNQLSEQLQAHWDQYNRDRNRQ